MDATYAPLVRTKFRILVREEGCLSRVHDVNDFFDEAFSTFLCLRTKEMNLRMQTKTQRARFCPVRNPDGTVSGVAKPVFQVHSHLVERYAEEHFWNDPPMHYLLDNELLHSFYVPKHFLMAVSKSSEFVRTANDKRVLDLLADWSNVRDAIDAGLNVWEMRKLGL